MSKRTYWHPWTHSPLDRMFTWYEHGAIAYRITQRMDGNFCLEIDGDQQTFFNVFDLCAALNRREIPFPVTA